MAARLRSETNVTPLVDIVLMLGWALWIRASLSARAEESPGSTGCWAW
jgi:biopolymer transport protein ExbD